MYWVISPFKLGVHIYGANPEIQSWEILGLFGVVRGCLGLSFYKLFALYLAHNVLFCEIQVTKYVSKYICSKKNLTRHSMQMVCSGTLTALTR